MAPAKETFNRAQEAVFRLPLAVLVEDEHRKISLANKYFCNLFQIPMEPQQLVGMDCGGLAEQAKSFFSNPEAFLSFIHQAINLQKTILDTELHLNDGRYVSASYEPYYKEAVFAGHIWIYKDITAKKLAENELLITIQKERQLNELQTRFVNMVSHEIRTPMAGILSSVELLELLSEDEGLQDLHQKYQKHFHRIKVQIQRVNELTNDVLSLGKIEAGQIKCHPEEVDVLKLVTEIIEHNFSSAIGKQKIKLEVEGVERKSMLDVGLLRHIITNLLSNALKYSAGRQDPVVRISYLERDVVLEIIDFGIGIPQKEQKDIFTAFSRASNAGNIEGTGLGLALVKHFVEMHKGKISFKSILDKGTVFKVTLPG